MAPALGSRSTAIEALRGVDLTGKTAVVTGGNSGIGIETARALSHAGARVIITSRNDEAGQEVADQLNSSGPKGKVELEHLDLADLANVQALCKRLQLVPSIDLLVLNAGVMACPKASTKNNFEMQVGTNHFGHFMLTTLLLDKLKQQDGPVRIVAVSSYAHQMGGLDLDDLHWRHRTYSAWKAYGQSKLCNILFAKELATRTAGTNVEAFSLHPGSIATNLGRHMGWMQTFGWLAKPFLKNPEQGAATSIYAATAQELSGKSGAYLEDCHIAQPSSQAQDAEVATKLWNITEQQIAEASGQSK